MIDCVAKIALRLDYVSFSSIGPFSYLYNQLSDGRMADNIQVGLADTFKCEWILLEYFDLQHALRYKVPQFTGVLVIFFRRGDVIISSGGDIVRVCEDERLIITLGMKGGGEDRGW